MQVSIVGHFDQFSVSGDTSRVLRVSSFRPAQAMALDAELIEKIENITVSTPNCAGIAPTANDLSINVFLDLSEGPLDRCVVVRINEVVRMS